LEKSARCLTRLQNERCRSDRNGFPVLANRVGWYAVRRSNGSSASYHRQNVQPPPPPPPPPPVIIRTRYSFWTKARGDSRNSVATSEMPNQSGDHEFRPKANTVSVNSKVRFIGADLDGSWRDRQGELSVDGGNTWNEAKCLGSPRRTRGMWDLIGRRHRRWEKSYVIARATDQTAERSRWNGIPIVALNDQSSDAGHGRVQTVRRSMSA